MKQFIKNALGLRSKKPKSHTFVPAGHFYSPIPTPEDFQSASHPVFDQAVRDLPGIRLNLDSQCALLSTLLRHFEEFTQIYSGESPAEALRFNFDQDFFKEADALALFAFLRHCKPKAVIEVGSGHSSALMLDSVLPGTWEPDITFIEPYPDRLYSVLSEADKARTKIILSFVQQTPLEDFLKLGDGDLLFIDSSHVSKIGSDVNFLFFDILPRLNPGVIIHIHDIFWPFEYPHSWIQEGRAWNESYLLRALLTGSDMFEIIFWNSYLGITQKSELEKNCPMFLKDTGGSIYLRKLR